jgi:hypothetical protein
VDKPVNESAGIRNPALPFRKNYDTNQTDDTNALSLRQPSAFAFLNQQSVGLNLFGQNNGFSFTGVCSGPGRGGFAIEPPRYNRSGCGRLTSFRAGNSGGACGLTMATDMDGSLSRSRRDTSAPRQRLRTTGYLPHLRH